MNNSEKESEIKLDTCLKNSNYNFEYVYYSPIENETLKFMFSKCSKTGNGRGVPDRIFYNNKTLIIFECKKDDLKKATLDLKHYCKNLVTQSINIDNVFAVSFVSEELYKIYKVINYGSVDVKFTILKKTLANLKPEEIFTQGSLNIQREIKLIHDYIYKYTKISNEDKSLFMAIILIGLKNDMFSFLANTVTEDKTNLYPILESILSSNDILESVLDMFKHLKHNQANEEHVYNIVRMVKNIYDKTPSMDLLNSFYSEFIKYGSTDSKALGIVLTPPHIVSLMTKLLNINENDVVLDLCTGTGSFVLESLKYKPKEIIACEYQFKLFSLLKCNLIIRDVDLDKYKIYNTDCFLKKFKATKSLINPPYGTEINEWDFILKQLNSVDYGGEICAIVPNSVISDSKTNRLYKEKIMKIAEVKNIILCRNSLFYPVANVSTVIIHLKKVETPNLDYKTNIIDYRDDGFVSERTKGFVSDESFENKFHNVISPMNNYLTKKLEITESWYILRLCDNNFNVKKSDCLSTNFQIEFLEKLLEIENNSNEFVEENNNEIIWKNFKISDLFEILSKPKELYNKELIGIKKVFQCAAKNNNNGVKGIVPATKDTFLKNKIVLVVGGDGGSGLAYYLSKDFIISSSVKVLSPLENLSNNNFKLNKNVGIFISSQLSENKKIYNRGHIWKNELIMNTTFKLPVLETEDNCIQINYKYINDLYV